MAENNEVTSFKSFTVTSKGLLLEAKAKTGAAFRFTRPVIGSGYLPDNADILSMTQLIDEIPSHQTGSTDTSAGADITYCGVLDKGVIGLRIQVRNGDTGFRLREIGIMAEDPDEGEILYAYGNAGNDAEPFAPYDGQTYIRWNLTIPFVTGNTANITANVTLPAELTVEEFRTHTDAAPIHIPIYFTDAQPTDDAYLWFAPYPSASENEAVLNAVAYNGDETKLHAEVDSETYTIDNTTVSEQNGETTVTINT